MNAMSNIEPFKSKNTLIDEITSAVYTRSRDAVKRYIDKEIKRILSYADGETPVADKNSFEILSRIRNKKQWTPGENGIFKFILI